MRLIERIQADDFRIEVKERLSDGMVLVYFWNTHTEFEIDRQHEVFETIDSALAQARRFACSILGAEFNKL